MNQAFKIKNTEDVASRKSVHDSE